MKRISIFLAAMLLTGGAYADLIAKNGNDSARLTKEPCPVAVLKVIPEGSRGYFRAAHVVIDGRTHTACWAMRDADTVFLAYSDGDAGMLPFELFEESPGV